MTNEVNINPNFELPSDFIKVRQDRIVEVYEADKRHYKKESERVAIGVIDDVFEKVFDMHVLEPMIKNEKYYVVKYQPKP